MNKYRKGQIVFLTKGEYSDFSIVCFARVLKDFLIVDLKNKYVRDNGGEEIEESIFRPSPFILWAEKEGYIEELGQAETPKELHFESYGYVTLEDRNSFNL